MDWVLPCVKTELPTVSTGQPVALSELPPAEVSQGEADPPVEYCTMPGE